MKKRNGSFLGLVLFVAAIMLTAIIYFNFQANNINKIYTAEAAITPSPTLAPPAIYAKPTDNLLRSGSIGPEVITLQSKLKELGFYSGDLDGQFGNGTKSALVLFQQQHGLEADGMAGMETMNLINSAAANKLTVTPKPELPAAKDTLPMLVNRKQAIPANYVPSQLMKLRDLVPKDLLILKDPDVQGDKTAIEALVKMIIAAKADGLEIWQVSEGYRTFSRQQELFDLEVQNLIRDEQLSPESARKTAERNAALPGYSEHHTGLAFDLTVPGYYFGDTKQAIWLEDHCFEYGFILRYTANKEDITGFHAEPWHVRYVGDHHARFMQEHNLALEEYLALY